MELTVDWERDFDQRKHKGIITSSDKCTKPKTKLLCEPRMGTWSNTVAQGRGRPADVKAKDVKACGTHTLGEVSWGEDVRRRKELS